MAAKDAYAGNEKILWKLIKSNEIGKLYLFYGIEEYLIRNYCRQIEKTIISEEFKLLNKVVLNGRISPAQIIENCRTAPVFSDRRLVIVRDSGLFKGGKKAAGREQTGGRAKKGKGASGRGKGGDELADFLQDMPEHVCLIFVEEEIDKRVKYVDLIEKNGMIVNFEYKKPDDMAGWVIKRLREMDHDADMRTASMIVDYCEQGMDDVLNELKKLCAYAGERSLITEDDVAKVCTRSVKSRIFDLTDAIAAKRTSAAISILNDMAVLREPMPRVLFMITRQFRQLIQAKLMLGDGAGRGEIASFFKIPPFIADKVIRQAKSFDMKSLEEAAARGLELDVAMKTGNLDDRTAVELMIIGSVGKSRAAK
ncbi:MAG: DNA polymerase III subunit delta [Clostridiaceae bacterium]|nr:DNA polymerase III subunit delta [Clostridiaceae bacterium]